MQQDYYSDSVCSGDLPEGCLDSDFDCGDVDPIGLMEIVYQVAGHVMDILIAMMDQMKLIVSEQKDVQMVNLIGVQDGQCISGIPSWLCDGSAKMAMIILMKLIAMVMMVMMMVMTPDNPNGYDAEDTWTMMPVNLLMPEMAVQVQ